jgi:hypothetical protein
MRGFEETVLFLRAVDYRITGQPDEALPPWLAFQNSPAPASKKSFDTSPGTKSS